MTYFSTGIVGDVVVVGASFAGIPTSAAPLSAGAKGLIGHDAGVGLDSAGISGLVLAQELSVPAVAIAGSSARLSDGRSLLLGTVSHANDAALELGVERHMPGEEAALLLLKARASSPRPSVMSRVDQTITRIAGDTEHGIYAVKLVQLQELPQKAGRFKVRFRTGLSCVQALLVGRGCAGWSDRRATRAGLDARRVQVSTSDHVFKALAGGWYYAVGSKA